MDSSRNVCDWSAKDIAAAVTAGSLSCAEVVESVLARIDEVDETLNAFAFVATEKARATAREIDRGLREGRIPGALVGVPISVKDNIETADMPTTYGSRVFAGNQPSSDAVCVERLRAAGAIIIGKTNLAEFAAKSTSDSPLHGTTRNPWKLDRTTGGSSGGSAAAVAAALGPLSVGNDQAGSVRIPASLCGVLGFKPTAGMIPFAPADDPWDQIFHVGLIGRGVEDIDLAFGVMRGHDARDPSSLPVSVGAIEGLMDRHVAPWRVAFADSVGMGNCAAEISNKTAEAVEYFAEGAGRVDSVTFSLADAELAYSTLVPFRRAAAMGHLVAGWRGEMDSDVADYIERGQEITPREYGEANRARTRVNQTVETVFEDYDLIVTPTVGTTAFDIERSSPVAIDEVELTSWRDWIPFTYPFNLTGHPAISVPVGESDDGLPIGLQIVGPRFGDRRVLSAADFLVRRIYGRARVSSAPDRLTALNTKEGP